MIFWLALLYKNAISPPAARVLHVPLVYAAQQVLPFPLARPAIHARPAGMRLRMPSARMPPL
jgi:hypothetical protein